jgi:CRISPR/Cas system CMR subunit Cmr6 (Cas7 group RAMP superfamily)
MSRKEMVSAKIGGKTYDRLENYSDEEGISRSQAIDRMLKQGLDVEESDMRLVPVKTDGGTEIENQLDSVESHLENQSEKIDSQQKNQNYLNLILVVSLVWIGIQLVVDLGALISAVTGIPLIVGIGYFYYQIYQEVNHE